MKDYDNYGYYTVHDMKQLTISACNRHALFPSTIFNIVNTTKDTGGLSAVYCERLSKLMMQDVSSGSLELSDHEFSELLLTLVSEARFICGSFMAALQSSPLFRLYCAFSQHKRSKLWTQDDKNTEMKKMDQFLVWLNSIGTNNGKEGLIKFKLFINHNNQPNYFSSINQNQLRYNIVNRGMIYLSDWLFSKCLKEGVYRTVEVVYKKCLANGVMFTSRGQHCRERQQLSQVYSRWGQQTADILPSNRINLCLADQCGNVKDYSSWCRILLHSHEDAANEAFESLLSPDTFEFGQLNCFFRCRLPVDEKILNDVPIASICVRKTARRGRNLFSVNARDERSTRDERSPILTTLKRDLFCAVYKIYPTPIIVAAMDNQMRPISKSLIIGRKEDVLNSIQTLLLIQMHRHRTINFNPTFPNVASMQLLTSSRNDHP
jgi:hypothetical protein